MWDEPRAHHDLMTRMCDEYDSWAMSLSTPSLQQLLAGAPSDTRIGAWVKPFAVFKPNVNPAYTWEPVFFWHVRGKRSRAEPTVRDFTWPAIEAPAVACNITLKRGLTGVKPEGFCFWMFEMLGLTLDDTLDDLFPGSGAVRRAWIKWRRQLLEVEESA